MYIVTSIYFYLVNHSCTIGRIFPVKEIVEIKNKQKKQNMKYEQ